MAVCLQVVAVEGSDELLRLLQASITEVHRCCGQIESTVAGAMSGATGQMAAAAVVKHAAAALASEVASMDATLGILSGQISRGKQVSRGCQGLLYAARNEGSPWEVRAMS